LSEVNLSTGADGTTITGVVVGFMPTNRESTIYGAANTERIALVCDDPSVIFQVRDDGGGTLSADTVGLNASLEDATAGSTVTGLSGYVLDGGTTTAPAADVSQPLLIIGLANIEGNEAADNAIWEVIISAHTYGARPITGIS